MVKFSWYISIQVTSVSAYHVCNNLALMGTCDYTINEVISQNNYSYTVSVSHARCNRSLDYKADT